MPRVPEPGSQVFLQFKPEQSRVYRDGWIATRSGHNENGKPKAWFFVLPVLALVAFNALVPMMTVVNYSVQETFGNNQFFWEGLGWFEQILRSDRFQAALGRQFLFTFLILLIEVPLGIIVALVDAAQRVLGAGLSGADGPADADPVERGRVDVEHLHPAQDRPAGLFPE